MDAYLKFESVEPGSHSSGGAAGGIVSEGQGYGMFFESTASHSSGGAAGGIVSEGQGYGMFFERTASHGSGGAAGGIVSEGQGYGVFMVGAPEPHLFAFDLM